MTRRRASVAESIAAAMPTLGPSTPRACRPAESRAIGRVVPGRSGGTIAGCATPATARPREGQWWIGLPVAGIGHAVRKSVASRRIRNEHKPRRADPIEDVARASQYALGRGAIPYPTGIEFPHIVGSSKCDPEHRIWRRFDQRFEDARETGRERASLEVPEGASDEEFREAVDAFAADDLRRDPQADEWTAAAVDCARGFQRRQGGRKTETDSRTSNRARRDAKAAGVDLTSAEYLDTLRPASRAAYLRRVHKMTGDTASLERAREIERDIRQRAPKKRR